MSGRDHRLPALLSAAVLLAVEALIFMDAMIKRSGITLGILPPLEVRLAFGVPALTVLSVALVWRLGVILKRKVGRCMQGGA